MTKKESTPDSELMMNRLKGEDFPSDLPPEAFLDGNIAAYFDGLLAELGVKKSDVIQKANIDRTYGYQILGGTRLANRDYYLRIAFAMGLTLRQTQRMLAVVGRSGLHPLIKRDAALIYALDKNYSREEVAYFLEELGLDPLEAEIL